MHSLGMIARSKAAKPRVVHAQRHVRAGSPTLFVQAEAVPQGQPARLQRLTGWLIALALTSKVGLSLVNEGWALAERIINVLDVQIARGTSTSAIVKARSVVSSQIRPGLPRIR